MSPGRLASLLEVLEVDLLVSDLRPASDDPVPAWRLDAELGKLRELRGRLRLRPFAVVPQPALLLVGADRDRPSRAIPLAEGQLLYVARQVVLVTGTRGHLDEDGFLYLTSPAPAVTGRLAAAHGHDPVAVGGSSLNRSADSPILVRKVVAS